MKLVLITLSFLLLQSCSTTGLEKKNAELYTATSSNYGNLLNVKFIDNYDGDTIKADIPYVHPLLGSKITVRLYGIDAPELRTIDTCEKIKALEAKHMINELLSKAKRVDLKGVQRDKYFRILAKVYADNVDVGDVLLKKGLAYAYYGDAKIRVNWCHD